MPASAVAVGIRDEQSPDCDGQRLISIPPKMIPEDAAEGYDVVQRFSILLWTADEHETPTDLLVYRNRDRRRCISRGIREGYPL